MKCSYNRFLFLSYYVLKCWRLVWRRFLIDGCCCVNLLRISSFVIYYQLAISSLDKCSHVNVLLLLSQDLCFIVLISLTFSYISKSGFKWFLSFFLLISCCSSSRFISFVLSCCVLSRDSAVNVSERLRSLSLDSYLSVSFFSSLCVYWSFLKDFSFAFGSPEILLQPL